MCQYSYDDAYTDKKASDYLAIETSCRYTSANIGKGFAAESPWPIAIFLAPILKFVFFRS